MGPGPELRDGAGPRDGIGGLAGKKPHPHPQDDTGPEIRTPDRGPIPLPDCNATLQVKLAFAGWPGEYSGTPRQFITGHSSIFPWQRTGSDVMEPAAL